LITLVALPTIWLVNRDEGGDSSRPNVAAVGIDPGEADQASADTEQFDPMGTAGAAYLDPLTSAQPPVSVAVAVGTAPDELVATALATYRRSADEVGTEICLFNGTNGGLDVTVVNVANGRSIRCTTSPRYGGAADELIMHQSRFEQIADLTAAPIHVEIRR
jgi:hypothetical protein